MADGIKISKALALYVWDELKDIVKAEFRMEMKVYERTPLYANGSLGGHMHAWYAAAEKYVLGFLKAWRNAKLKEWKEEGTMRKRGRSRTKGGQVTWANAAGLAGVWKEGGTVRRRGA